MEQNQTMLAADPYWLVGLPKLQARTDVVPVVKGGDEKDTLRQ
jgi:hypothetical protein